MKFIYILLIVQLFSSCQKEPKKILPSDYLNKEQIEAFKYDIIRYSGKLAKNATDDSKFETKFDSIYHLKAKSAELYYYYEDKNAPEVYFAIARIAPSLKIKRVVTAGKLIKDKAGNITFYEEVFRTWKMEIPELKSKSKLLFENYIEGNDLTKFYTKNSKEEFLIEFPDEINFYNSALRRWDTKK